VVVAGSRGQGGGGGGGGAHYRGRKGKDRGVQNVRGVLGPISIAQVIKAP